MLRREAETAPGKTCMATVRAVVSMFAMHKVVAFEDDIGHSQSGRNHAGVLQMEMSDFIEDLIPGTDAHADPYSAGALAVRTLKQYVQFHADAFIAFQIGSKHRVPGLASHDRPPGVKNAEALCPHVQAFIPSQTWALARRGWKSLPITLSLS